jgi:hypothetical protein
MLQRARKKGKCQPWVVLLSIRYPNTGPVVLDKVEW